MKFITEFITGESNCVSGRCLIQGGTFTMGSPEGVGYPDEHPQREVTISSFLMGQTETSIGEYGKYTYSEFGKALWQIDLSRMIQLLITADVINKGRCGEINGKGADYPVVCLTMQEKRDYCQGQGGDLPTAAQFEYAARFDEQDAGADQLVIWHNGYRSTVPVTTGYQNRFGIFNLLGNVWESMRDEYDRDFYARMPGTDPYNPLTNPYDARTNPEGQLEEFRGASFHYERWEARVAGRRDGLPVYRNDFDGLRCVWPALSEVEGPPDSK